MAKNSEPSVLTDILRYDKDKGQRVKLRDCELITKFLFNRNDFYVVRKGNVYMVCLSVNDELVLLTKEKAVVDGIEVTVGEVMGNFRRGYLKNGITQDRIDMFIEDPVKYREKYNKTAGQQ